MKRNKKVLFLVIFSLLSKMIYTLEDEDSSFINSQRPRRSVISLPSNSVLGITLDFIVPVLPLINQTNTYLWLDFPFTVTVPQASDLNNMYTNKSWMASSPFRRFRRRLTDHQHVDWLDELRTDQDRRIVYKYIEGIFNSWRLNGSGCLQRTICELAETPLAGHGLFGQVVHLILSPSLTNHDEDGSLKIGWIHSEEDEYSMAYRKGLEMSGSSCSNYFASLCPFSFVKLLDL